MEMAKKFKERNLAVIHSKTSHNNSKICKVIGYTNGAKQDTVRVRIGDSVFNIKEDSIRSASNFDIIRNMSDEQLSELIPRKKRKQAAKNFREILRKE